MLSILCGRRALFVAAAAFAGSMANAASITWQVPTGSYDVGANWSTGSVPTSGDVALIANGGVSTLTLSGSTTGAQLTIGQDGGGTFVLGGSGTHGIAGPLLVGWTTDGSATEGAGTITIGSGATLRIDAGSGNSIIGSGANTLGGSGTVTISAGGALAFNGSGKSLIVGETLNGSVSTAALDVQGTLDVEVGELQFGRGQGGGGTGTGTLTVGPNATVTTHDWTKFGTDIPFGNHGGGVGRLIMTGGTFNKLGGGRLVFGNYDGTGEAIQSGGVVNIAGTSEGINIGAFGFTGVGSYTLSSGTINVSSGMFSIGRQGGQGTFTMTGGLVQKTSPDDFEVGEGGSGVMTVSGGLVDIQAGDLAIGKWGATGSVTINGSGVVRAGNVIFSKNASSPSATLTLGSGGRLEAAKLSSSDIFATTQLTFNGGRLVATANQPAFMANLSAATIDAGGATIDTQGYTVAMTQPLSGFGSLTKVGSGALTMTGAGSYSGDTIVSEGSLTLSTAHTGGGAATVAAGASFGVAVAGSLNSQVTLSSLGLGSASSMTIDLASFGNPSTAPLNVLGGLTTSGGSTIINFATGAPAAGTVPLISYGSLNAFNFTLGTLPAGMQASLVNNSAANRIDLLISSIPIRRWTGAVSSVWDTTTANWVSTFTGTGPTAVFANGDGPVLFTDEAVGSTSITLNTAVQPISVAVTNNALPYTITGSGTIGGTGGLTKSGVAQLTIGTRNTYTGATRLEGGVTSVAVLANGGTASGIGASGSAASNLVFAGGTLEYTGTSLTTNRGFSLAGDGGIISITQTNALLTFSGTVTAESGSLRKTGGGNLRLTGTSNVLGRVSEGAGFIVESGSMTLAGATPVPTAQINTVTGDVLLGGIPDTPASLTLTNSTLNLSGWLSLGHETNTANTTTTMTRAAVTANALRLGYGSVTNSGSHALSLTNSSVSLTGEALIGNIGPSVGSLSVLGTSSFRAGGDMNVGNSIDTQGFVTVGGSASLTVVGRLRVGDLGLGSLVATGTSRLTLDQVQVGNVVTSTGTMTLDSDSAATLSGYIAVGNTGNGTLAMSGRSRMSVQYDLNVADLPASVGTMTIADRASASAGSFFIGKGDASGGTVTITGGTLAQTNTGGDFVVGRDGAGALTISGSGSVVASATSGVVIGATSLSQSAGIELNGGVLTATRVRKGDGVSAGLTFNSGTLRAASGAASSFVSGLTNVTVLPGGAVIDTNGQRVTFESAITDGGGGGLTKVGSGTLSLTGLNTYLGPTAVQAGTLRIDGDSSFASGAVTVASGATLAGTGTVGGATTIQTGATLAPGASPGTLSFTSGLTLGGGGNYNWQMLSATGTAGDTSSWDLVTVGGALTVNATSVDPFKINLWTLSGINPDVSGNATNFNSSQDYTWTIATASGGIAGFAADKFTVITSATNGTGGFANSFGAGTFAVAQSGNDLQLVFTHGSAPSSITINVASGTQTQTAAGYPTLSGTLPLLKTGAGTLVVDQVNTISGSTTIQGGVLQVANLQALQSSTIVPVAGGTMALSPYLVTVVGGLAPNAGGLTDVGSGLVTVSAGLSATDMVTAIISGFGDGTWNGTSGITSSVVAADAQLGIPRAIGWLDNGDGTVTFAYAAPGDTNLDWSIDLLDIGTYLAGAKYDTGEPASWSEGDYTYDGIVDITDVALYLGTALFDVGPYNPPAGAAGSVASVPEPALGVAAIASLAAVAGIRAIRRRA